MMASLKQDTDKSNQDINDKEYAVDELEYGLFPKGLCGLTNIGNTCYMNSALQALSNCSPLTQFFLKCDFLIDSLDDGRPSVAMCYAKLMQSLWDRQYSRQKHITPSALSRAVRQVYTQFRGFGQQDSQEFLRCLMDRLHEELKKPVHYFKRHRRGASVGRGSASLQNIKLLGGNSDVTASTVDCTLSVESDNDTSPVLPPGLGQDVYMTENDDSTWQSHNIEDSLKQRRQFHSIVTDLFDGKLLSSVQCLTCNRVSTTVETFQDLSLPIPGKEDLEKIRSHGPSLPNTSKAAAAGNGSGLIGNYWCWMQSWFTGPQISLQDCLAAFFANDELKGDNMYNCGKCHKLRNGVKFSRVYALPEILCIHMKRFRHELYFSQKINALVSFPVSGLDMSPFLSDDAKAESTLYDLTAVVTHFGTVGAGHYIAYARNALNGHWYEFNDSWVTEVSEETVASAEAYVLFYVKRSNDAQKFRCKVYESLQKNTCSEQEEMMYISQEWMTRFRACADPGPITNFDLLCRHGGVAPKNADIIHLAALLIPKTVWKQLKARFGGGPDIKQLKNCLVCKELVDRRVKEMAMFSNLHEKFQAMDSDDALCLSISWYKKWNAFVRDDTLDPPPPINNTDIIEQKEQKSQLIDDADYGLISRDMWNYLHSIYGGGPVVHSQVTSGGSSTTDGGLTSSDLGSEESDEGANATIKTT